MIYPQKINSVLGLSAKLHKLAIIDAIKNIKVGHPYYDVVMKSKEEAVRTFSELPQDHPAVKSLLLGQVSEPSDLIKALSKLVDQINETIAISAMYQNRGKNCSIANSFLKKLLPGIGKLMAGITEELNNNPKKDGDK